MSLEEARKISFQQEKLAAIGTLAAGIVHEIGNPVTADRFYSPAAKNR